MSKFDKIFEARESEILDKSEKNKTSPIRTKSHDKRKTSDNQKSSITVIAKEKITQENAKRGRPTAKRSHPDFVGLTTYVRRETHTKAKIALLQEGKGRELSELVEDLIAGWLGSK